MSVAPDEQISVDPARQTAWIVYINGIEVPAVSVSISYGVWAIPECQITMVPDPILHRLGAEDRVSVQVFYLDYWQTPKNQFRLMFDGEIVGWSYVNVQRSRSLVFNCVDYVQIFTQLFFFFMSSMDDIAVGVSGQEIGLASGELQTAGYGALYPYSLFSGGLADPGEDTGDGALIKRPIDFAYNIVRSLIKAQHRNRTVPGTNFFTPWARKTNFHRRWIALPFLEDSDNPGVFPILRSVNAQYALDAVARMSSDIGNAGSIWEMLKQVLSVLMMEVNMLPTAPLVSGDIRDLVPAGAPQTDSTAEGTNTLLLGNYFVKPQFLFGLPPAFNVFFPSQITQLMYEENYITQPTRMYFSEEALTSYLRVDSNTSRGLGTLVRDALAVGHPEEVNLAMRSSIQNGQDTGKNVLVYPEEFFKGPVIDRRPMPRWFFFLQSAQQSPTSDTDATPDLREVAPGDSSRDLYRKYAAYEYHKERYSRRTGTLNMAFNPYPVPGFPCAVFDRRSTQVDIFGYVTNVRQTLTNNGWSTSVGFSYGRTFQEVFDLLGRNIALENEGLDADQSRVEEAVNTDNQASLDTRADPVGAIAMAPAEPIVEIRDIVQNYERADAFYRALFYRGESPDTVEITQRQAQTDNTFTTASDPDPLDRDERPAVFRYDTLIAYQNEDGSEERIQISGLDASTRAQILEGIAAVRAQSVSDEELAFLREVLDRPELAKDTPTSELNELEIKVRTTGTDTNVDGGRLFRVRDRAKHYFTSYDAAMQFGARPICTLEEYIRFLGEDGVRQGRVDPTAALRDESVRTFPAPYYARIRAYRNGPPPPVPDDNITNSPVQTSQVSGVSSQESNDNSATVNPQGDTQVRGIPEDFPETRANWDALLLQYRENVLSYLPPRN